jgi:peptide deformylase
MAISPERGTRLSEQMAALGIVQLGDPILRRPTHPLTLPDEARELDRIVRLLVEMADRVQQQFRFDEDGMGLAAPQIGIGRSIAIFRPGREQVVLVNPVVLAADPTNEVEWEENSEGCLSFFDERYWVPRPRRIVVSHLAPSGKELTSTFEEDRLARDVLHEVDHLNGVLCVDRMRPGGRKVYVGDGIEPH